MKTFVAKLKSNKEFISVIFWFFFVILGICFAIDLAYEEFQDENILLFIVSLFIYSGILKSLADDKILWRYFDVKKETMPELFYIFLIILFIMATLIMGLVIEETIKLYI